MQVTFIQVAFKKDMIKYEVNGEEKWANCTSQVKGFAKNFSKGETVTLQGSEQNGMFNVTRIEKGSGSGAPAQTQSYSAPAQSAPAQSTYKTPAQTGNSYDYQKPKSPEETKLIVNQSVMASACNAVKAVTGQIDPNMLGDYVVTLYHRLRDEVNK